MCASIYERIKKQLETVYGAKSVRTRIKQNNCDSQLAICALLAETLSAILDDKSLLSCLHSVYWLVSLLFFKTSLAISVVYICSNGSSIKCIESRQIEQHKNAPTSRQANKQTNVCIHFQSRDIDRSSNRFNYFYWFLILWMLGLWNESWCLEWI